MTATISSVDDRNAETSRLEVEAFKTDTPGPYFAYLSGNRITTWTGDLLALVTWKGTPWRNNLGDTRQAFNAEGINGTRYAGVAYVSAGDYVRMRPVKS